MKTLNLFAMLALLLSLFSACSTRLSYFTQDLYDKQRWSEDELKQIQFYVSQNIVLKRQHNAGDGSSEIIAGKIKIEDGKEIEEVVIPRGTPGTLVFMPKENRFAIGFEDGKERYLMFGPSPKYNDRFVLLASEWKNKSGEVTYDKKEYRVSTEDAFAALMVDLRKINKSSVNSRVAKGRKVGS